ncbi:GMC family oxidoreductase N-terminal domain-containing protein [Paraburkholderia sp. PREW-6R]|uniref:GMC family oxidoreductase n=1 Tax=Paraburkholderia sp. PREW-6R TaxID=3141544 RepID=UPI0031F47F15
MTDPVYDVIVVGAGAAGCAMAARLSEDPVRRVLLIEAGSDLVAGREPPVIRDPFPSGYGDPRYSWADLRVTVGPDRGNGRGAFARQYTQGRVLGGSSSINGMVAQRGLPEDFEDWARSGATGWDWAGVLPYYRKLENDQDFDGPMHGRNGPMVIRRQPRGAWPPFSRAIAETLVARGYPLLEDLHADDRDGVAVMPMNNLPEHRMSSASAYLTEATRQRANLDVMCNSDVVRIAFDGRTVTGVHVRRDDGAHFVHGREVVLCAGAIFSPTLLLRSGVGPAGDLTELGIPVVADLPGVGRHLQNHPGMHVAVHLPQQSIQPAAMRCWSHSLLRYSSGMPGCTRGDMYLFPVSKTAWHPIGRRVGAISLCVQKPFSRGSVTLRDARPDTNPAVDFNLLSDERDFKRMVAGLRLAMSLLDDPNVRPHINNVFHPTNGQANALNRVSTVNWMKSWLFDKALDVSPGIRRRLLGDAAIDPGALMQDEAALAHTVREYSAGVHHVAGSCRMGSRHDAQTVVDSEGRVIGVNGLRVADTSIMPSIVTACTHLTAIMIGEKIADAIRQRGDEGWQAGRLEVQHAG